jgi:hypothetical protein
MDWTEVGAFPTAAEAALARQMLEAEGIEVMVSDENTGNLWQIPAVAEVKLSVQAADVERATKLLDEAQARIAAEPEDETDLGGGD